MNDEQLQGLKVKADSLINDFRVVISVIENALELNRQAETQKQKNIEEREELTRQTTFFKQQQTYFNKQKEDFAQEKADFQIERATLAKQRETFEDYKTDFSRREEEFGQKSLELEKKTKEVEEKLEEAKKLDGLFKQLAEKEAEHNKKIEVGRIRDQRADAREERIATRERELQIINEA